MSIKKGFTLIEVLLVIAIFTILTGVVLVSFKRIGASQAIDRSAFLVVTTLNQARSLTLSSKDGSRYGVRFASSSMIIFKGDTYVANDPDNISVELNSQVVVNDTSLPGDEIVFIRISGGVEENGSVILSLVSDPTETAVINIYETGLSEID